jgi:hypothetical protein
MFASLQLFNLLAVENKTDCLLLSLGYCSMFGIQNKINNSINKQYGI